MSSSPDSTTLTPVRLSPSQEPRESPLGISYDLLIKPPSATRSVYAQSPCRKTPLEHRMKSVEENKKAMSAEQQARLDEVRERRERAQRRLTESFVETQREKIDKLAKKEAVSEDLRKAIQKEAEEKLASKKRREMEAKEIARQLEDEKRQLALDRLHMLQIAEENRKGYLQDKVEKAALDLCKVEAARMEKDQKQRELAEQHRLKLMSAEMLHNTHICEIKERCTKHVEKVLEKKKWLETQKGVANEEALDRSIPADRPDVMQG